MYWMVTHQRTDLDKRYLNLENGHSRFYYFATSLSSDMAQKYIKMLKEKLMCSCVYYGNQTTDIHTYILYVCMYVYQLSGLTPFSHEGR